MDYILTIRDILAIIRRAWRTILAITLVFAILGGGYYLYRVNGKTAATPEEIEANASDLEAYETWTASRELLVRQTQESLARAYQLATESPIMQLDAFNSEFYEIILVMDGDDDVTRYAAINAWLTEKYGDIYSGDTTYLLDAFGYNGGETMITLWGTDDYDLDQAAKEVEDYIVRTAEANQIKILSTVSVKREGASQRLFELQHALRDDITRLQAQLTNFNNTSTLKGPTPIATGRASTRSMLKYILAGIIGGLFLGLIFTVFQVVRKGTLLSGTQVRETSGLPELGSYDPQDEHKEKLLSAAVKAVAAEEPIMVIDDIDTELCAALAAMLSAETGQTIIGGSTALSSSDDIEQMAGCRSVIIPVRYGKSTVKDLQEEIQWAQRFKKSIAGYVVLEG